MSFSQLLCIMPTSGRTAAAGSTAASLAAAAASSGFAVGNHASDGKKTDHAQHT
ncbi:MAG: hypothetical protein II627_00985 [Lachnospiraceae bacterium]|nr:hypothetical protein [Lachnospiraceae bacterium]